MVEPRDEIQSWRDPLVEEVRSAREALLAACGYDLEELSKRLNQQQLASRRKGVTLPPRPPGERRGPT